MPPPHLPRYPLHAFSLAPPPSHCMHADDLAHDANGMQMPTVIVIVIEIVMIIKLMTVAADI